MLSCSGMRENNTGKSQVQSEVPTADEAVSSTDVLHKEPAGAIILRLVIKNFRGIEKLTWYPKPNVNILLGGGDVGKTTVLDALALLLSPTNTTSVADTDYKSRKPEDEFSIEAVMSLPGSMISQQPKMVWPWEWNGAAPILPKADGDPASSTEVVNPVYVVRVRGTGELELAYEILQPDETVDHFSVSLRRQIGLVRLAGDDRNDRDLRLVQGSALDRLLLSDRGLRGRIGQQVSGLDIQKSLKSGAKDALTKLDKTFQENALPSGLDIGLTGAQGISVASLIGLTATKDDIALPMTSWGAGTRRLASLAIAASLQGEFPITIVDEIERGLETYRQRGLIADLQSNGSQVFLTTHSVAALRAATKSNLWYMDNKCQIGALESEEISAHRLKEPETFLSRLAIIGEGITEVGFITELLERDIGQPLEDQSWSRLSEQNLRVD